VFGPVRAFIVGLVVYEPEHASVDGESGGVLAWEEEGEFEPEILVLVGVGDLLAEAAG
jgi:hypothetical protein